jgi:hypothetical protein
VIALTQIHQIEITSECNLRCKYCAHPKMQRAKMDMSWEIYERTIYWAKWFQARGTQGSVNLAGIGESTIHPEFIKYIRHARKELGEKQKFVLATNGVAMTQDLANEMLDAFGGNENADVFVSLHRPEKAGPAIEMLKKVGLVKGVSADAAISGTDWAGQVNWFVSAAKGSPCPWVRGGWAIVLSDGRVSRCAFDATGIGVFAHVNDDLRLAQTSPYSLCRACHQDVGLPLPEEKVA